MRQLKQIKDNNDISLWRLVINNVPLVLFLVLAVSGMMAVYIYFTPQAVRSVEAAAENTNNGLLVAPIIKPNSSRIVAQRFAQSPPPLRVGIIAGHLNNDSGAVCDDGLTEAQINLDITLRVAEKLREAGVRVVVLAEFDPRLTGYTADALISLHADSCADVGADATGYKMSPSPFSESSALYDCMVDEYATSTELPFHANTITEDMIDYHAFREIGFGTPAVIVETGFMNLDRTLLTTNADIPATGIANGLLCYLRDSS